MDKKTIKRDQSIDIIKGIGITIMVLGHTDFKFSNFIYLFHMAIFFIVSGYLYKDEYSDNCITIYHYIIRKIKTLWVPYFIWTSIYIILNNFFIHINIYTNNLMLLKNVEGVHINLHDFMSIKKIIIEIIKSFCFFGGTELGGAFWFLRVLFIVSVLYCIIECIIKKILKRKKYIMYGQLVISILSLNLGYFLYLCNIELHGLSMTFSIYSLFYIGFLLKKLEIIRNINPCISIAITFIILSICNNFGSIALSKNSYENPIFFLCVSISGYILLYSCTQLLVDYKIMVNIVSYIGRNSLCIILLHFLSFKIINLIGIIYYDQPYYLIAAFPVLYKGYFWWVAYTLCGIGVPLLLQIGYKKVLQKIVILNKL